MPAASLAAVIAAGLAGKDARLVETVRALRAKVKSLVPGARETLNPWSMPSFEADGPFAYFSLAKSHVTFGFLRGTALSDPEALLEGTGKNLRHVKLRRPEDVERPALAALIAAAAALNRASPPSGMGGASKARAAKAAAPANGHLPRQRRSS